MRLKFFKWHWRLTRIADKHFLLIFYIYIPSKWSPIHKKMYIWFFGNPVKLSRKNNNRGAMYKNNNNRGAVYKIQNNFLNFFQRLEVPFFCLKLNFRMFLNVFKLFYMRFNIFLKVFEKIPWRSVHSASFGVHSASFGVHSASDIFTMESYLKWTEAPQTTKIWSLDCFATFYMHMEGLG